MRFEGRVDRDGRFWLAEISAFDALTQGRTKREALAMAEDLIETMADSLQATESSLEDAFINLMQRHKVQ